MLSSAQTERAAYLRPDFSIQPGLSHQVVDLPGSRPLWDLLSHRDDKARVCRHLPPPQKNNNPEIVGGAVPSQP